ncbi:MAG: hypothetical protein QF752_07200 [Planctomycetota bacterium]|jgi:hypothetical protein|nr:hypothetical protein [Planctomycetota bacterium]
MRKRPIPTQTSLRQSTRKTLQFGVMTLLSIITLMSLLTPGLLPRAEEQSHPWS